MQSKNKDWIHELNHLINVSSKLITYQNNIEYKKISHFLPKVKFLFFVLKNFNFSKKIQTLFG